MDDETPSQSLNFIRIESWLRDRYWLAAPETVMAQVEQKLRQKYLMVHWQTVVVASTLLGSILLGCVLTSVYAMSLTIVDWAGHKAVVDELDSLRRQAEGQLKQIRDVVNRTNQTGLSPAVESQIAAPIGSVIAFPADEKQAPPHWLLCDGSLLNQDDYPDLYAVLGVRYGGEGTGKFGLPDYQGCSLEGIDGWGPTTFEAETGEIRRQLGAKRIQAGASLSALPFREGAETVQVIDQVPATVATSPQEVPNRPADSESAGPRSKTVKVLWLIRAK